MLTLKLQAKDYQFTLLPQKLNSYPFPNQRQDQSKVFSKLNTLNLSCVTKITSMEVGQSRILKAYSKANSERQTDKQTDRKAT